MAEYLKGFTFTQDFIQWDSEFQKHFNEYQAKSKRVYRLINTAGFLTPIGALTSISTHDPVFAPLGAALSVAAGVAGFLRLNGISKSLERNHEEIVRQSTVTLKFRTHVIENDEK